MGWVGMGCFGLGLAWGPTACSDEPGGGATSTTTTTVATGGGGGAGGATPGVGGAGTGGEAGAGGNPGCTSHENAAAAVALEQIAADAPTATGGPIARGTYELVAVKRYTGPGGDEGPNGTMYTETQVWSAVDMQSVLEFPDGQGERRLQFAYDLQDGSGGISLQVVCPETPLSVPWDRYTATATTLTLFATPVDLAFEYDLTEPEDDSDDG
ncbi:MAG: hypothetical protein AAF715_28300 [Myxococcota bacterium]